MKHQAFQQMAIGIVGFILMVLITGCAGVSSAQNLTGSLVTVDPQHHSITLNANGRLYTINGLTDQEVAALQGQLGKVSSMVSIQATQNSNGSYTIAAGQNSITFTVTTGTNGTASTNGNNGSSGPNEPGTILVFGTVKNANSSSVVVSLPNGQDLTININGQTKLEDFNGSPSGGQVIKVEATANQNDGSFIATELKKADLGDLQNQDMSFQGITSSTVGPDNIIHLRIGNQNFNFTIVPGTTKLEDFSNNPQFIGSNVAVQVKVRFQGTTGTVQEIKHGNA